MSLKVTVVSQQAIGQRYAKVEMYERNELDTEDVLIYTHHMPVTSREGIQSRIQVACDDVYQKILAGRAREASIQEDPLIGLVG